MNIARGRGKDKGDAPSGVYENADQTTCGVFCMGLALHNLTI